MGSLFPCLPDELGWECLLRVELDSHHNLRCVSKSWKAALKSTHFYQERKILKISEQRICIFRQIERVCNRIAVYDPEKNSCKNLPPIPAETDEVFHCHFHFVKQKLVLITDLVHGFKRSCTWLYDFSCSKWLKGVSLPRRLIGFACAADGQRGLIYVGGGFRNDRRGKRVRSASVYNVEEDKWENLPDMNTYMDPIKSVFANGKFYVMGNPSGPSFEVFDPNTRTWKTMENSLNSWHRFVDTFGCFKSFSDRGLTEYDYSRNKLHVVGLKYLNRGIQFSLVIGHKIFMINRDPNEDDQGFYMLEPPSERGGAIKWSRIERSSGLQGIVTHAVTLDL